MPAELLSVHPKYRGRFAGLGLVAARDFLDLPGDVIGGHPDRHVVRVELGEGGRRVVAYLKREHRIPWRDRLSNALAGFGWVTKSGREAATLREMADAGLPVPVVLATGESGGRAFLLVKAIRGAVSLPDVLRGTKQFPAKRKLLARRLGELLARFHDAGFDLPDLSAKHVLVHPRRLDITLIDVPRSRCRAAVPRADRVRDLALLHATLVDGLTSVRERIAFLNGYSRGRSVREWAADVERTAHVLRDRRGTRIARCEVGGAPRMRWLDGEQLVMTCGFWRRCHGDPPDWLTFAARAASGERRRANIYWDGRVLSLLQTPPAGLWKRLLARLAGRPAPSEGVRLSGFHNRLARAGVPAPRLLAFGRRANGSGFLLTRSFADTVPLATWLRSRHPQRAAVVRATGDLLRRLHAVGLQLDTFAYALHVRSPQSRRPSVVVADVGEVRKLPRSAGRVPLVDLGRLVRAFDLNERDGLRAIRGYLGGGPARDDCRRLLNILRAGLPHRGASA